MHSPLPTPATRSSRTPMAVALPASRLLRLTLLAGILLHSAVPASAQICADVSPGDAIRFSEGSMDVQGSIVALGADRLTVNIRGVEQTLDRHTTLATAEVKCRLTRSRGPGILSSMVAGAVLGGTAGFAIGKVLQDPAPAPEQRCGGWFGCWTYQPPAPAPPIDFTKGALVGAGVGLVWAAVLHRNRGWAPLNGTGGLAAVRPVLEPTPGEPGTWSVGLRVPVGNRP